MKIVVTFDEPEGGQTKRLLPASVKARGGEGGGRRRWGRFLPKVFGVDVQPEPALL